MTANAQTGDNRAPKSGSVEYPGLREDDLRPMTPEEVAAMRAERITEKDPELCRVPGAADKGICGYAGSDGKSACGLQCIYQRSQLGRSVARSEGER